MIALSVEDSLRQAYHSGRRGVATLMVTEGVGRLMADPLRSAWLTLKGVEEDVARSKWLQGLIDEKRDEIVQERPARRAAERLHAHDREEAEREKAKRLEQASEWATEDYGDELDYIRQMRQEYPDEYDDWVHEQYGRDPLAEEDAEENPFAEDKPGSDLEHLRQIKEQHPEDYENWVRIEHGGVDPLSEESFGGYAGDDSEPLSLLGGGASSGRRLDPVTGEYVDEDEDEDGIKPLEAGASVSDALNHPRTKLSQGFVTEERWNPETGEYEEVQVPKGTAASGRVAATRSAPKAQGKGAKRYKAKDWGEAALSAQHGFAELLSIIDGGREVMPSGKTQPFVAGEAGQAHTAFAPPAFPAPPGMVKVGMPSGQVTKPPFVRIIPSTTFDEVDPRQLNWPPDAEEGDA